MSAKALSVSALACGAMVAVSAAFLDMTLGQAAVLAPIIVVTVGATVFIVALWVKIAVDSIRRQEHPGRIVAGLVGGLALLVVLSFFVTLPSAH